MIDFCFKILKERKIRTARYILISKKKRNKKLTTYT